MKTKQFKENAKRFFDAYDKLWFEGENEDPEKLDEFCMQLVNYMRYVYEKGKADGILQEKNRLMYDVTRMAEYEELIEQCQECRTPEFWCSIEDNGLCKECNINLLGETQEEAEKWCAQWAK